MKRMFCWIGALILSSSNLIDAQQTLPAVYGGGAPVNYVRIWDALKPETNAANITVAAEPADFRMTTAYLDGLGRPLQTVIKKGSWSTGGTAADMVSTVVYDDLGRERYKYLPFGASDLNGNNHVNDGFFKLNPFPQQVAFYNTQLSGQTGETNVGVNSLNWAYGQTDFEASPLNRVLESFAPGASWVGSAAQSLEADRHSTKMKYYFNTAADDVQMWNVTNGTLGTFGTYAAAGTYDEAVLIKTVSVDEQNKQVIEFRDKDGKVILKKVQLDPLITDDGSGSGYTGWLCTYYIYDDLTNLRCVVQPEGVKTLATNDWELTSLLDEQCFRYEYDDRNRMILKKVPGAGEVYMVYDPRDRLTYTQDANMRVNEQWLAMFYDDLNRPRMTGMMVYAGSWADLQGYVEEAYANGDDDPITVGLPLPPELDISSREIGRTEYKASKLINFSIGFEAEDEAQFTAEIVGGLPGSETVDLPFNPLPPDNDFVALIINYYDDYAWTNKSFSNANNGQLTDVGSKVYAETLPSVASTKTKGLATGSKVRVLEDPADLATGFWLETASFYDDKGRTIQVANDNYLQGVDVVTSHYNFSGKVLNNLTFTHVSSAGIELLVKNDIDYDELSRPVATWKTEVSFSAEKHQVTRNEYDALGQLTKKTLAPGYNNGAGLESLAYEYNVRGWLLGMNRPFARDANNSNYFGFDLGYDKTANGLAGGQSYAQAQYNGNIEGMVWKSKGDGKMRKYDFSYDAVNRLTAAEFNQYNGGMFNRAEGVDFSVSNLHYDGNGNILSMDQKGLKLAGSSWIDQMKYTYVAGTNKLSSVTDFANDPVTELGDFRTAATHPQATAKAALTPSSTLPDLEAITDYAYDANGNMHRDNNKAIGDITYNYLNLPAVIQVTGKGTIRYTYDAVGNKLKKTTMEIPSEANGNISTTSETTYLNGCVLESKGNDAETTGHNIVNDGGPGVLSYTNKLLFQNMEEGRIRFLYPDPAHPYVINEGFTLDYMIKDHLGNVRMLLTEEQRRDLYPVASLEPAKLTTEERYYNIDDTKIVTSPVGVAAYTNDNGIGNNPSDPAFESANSAKMYKLNSTTNKTGLGITLKVMAGDVLDIHGKSYWANANTGGSGLNAAPAVLDLLNGMLGSPSASVLNSHTTAIELNGITGVNTPIGTFIGEPGRDDAGHPTRPKAFINYLFMDEQFRYAGGGTSAVSSTTGLKDHFSELQGLVAPKNGYVYIYVSNESPVDVFFDNLQVVHTRSPLVEETHYYPFGLTMAGISSKALAFGNPQNRYKFNDGTELENKEFSDGSGLETYATTYRSLDPQIGRFWQIDPLAEISHTFSPYNYANNNPIALNDPSGLEPECPDCPTGKLAEVKVLDEVVVKGVKPRDWANGQVYAARSRFWDLWEGPRVWIGHRTLPGHKLNWEVRYAVNYKGYLTGGVVPTELAFTGNVGTTPLNLRAIFRLKNFLKSEYSIYQGIKDGLPYFGKAKGGLLARYTQAEIQAIGATVIEGLEKIPSNAVALGVEQLVIDLNGGVKSGLIANKIPATIKEIYINEARSWLDANLPSWEQVLKFK